MLNITSNKIDKNTRISTLKNLKNIAIVVIDEDNIIFKMNRTFKSLFCDGNTKGTNWETFIFNNFKIANDSCDSNNFYIYRNDVNNRYILESETDSETGLRYCWLYKVTAHSLTRVANSCVDNIQSRKTDIFSLLEDTIYMKSLFWENHSIKLNEVEYEDEANLYISKDDSMLLVNGYVELLYSLLNLKQGSAECEISLRRKYRGGDLVIVADYKYCDLSLNDFHADLQWNGTTDSLRNIAQKIESQICDFDISILFDIHKSIDITDFQVKIIISDKDGVKWHAINK